MRIKLMFVALLFLLPSDICGFKENKNSKIETENLAHIDVSDEPDIEHNDKTVKTVEMREAGVLTDDYAVYPLCGDKPMWLTYTCFCGNRTLSGIADLRERNYYCCVPPSGDGQDQCKYSGRTLKWCMTFVPIIRTSKPFWLLQCI